MKTRKKRNPPQVGVVEACRRVHRVFFISDRVLAKVLGLRRAG
jgi:hypothetical protein